MRVEKDQVGHEPAVFICLVIVTLVIPPVGIVAGTLDLLFGSNKKQSQGVWLLLLGLAMSVIFLAVKFSL